METCDRCQEYWFATKLKDRICCSCFIRDRQNQTPFLMSAKNWMDPGVFPAHLPTLTQIKGMIIVRSYVQMVLYCYRGYQYHYSRYCVSFMQNMIKTVDMLLNLPSELDIMVLWSYGLRIIWRMRLSINTGSGHIFGFRRVTLSPGSGS